MINEPQLRIACTAVFIIGWLGGCATPLTTTVKSVWKDPQLNAGGIHHILMIGVFPNLQRRKQFEDAFARQVRKHGAHVSCSYRYFPQIQGVDREQVRKIVQEQTIDAVFVTRLVGQKDVKMFVPGNTANVPADPLDGPYKYFSEGSKEVTTPGYTVDQTVVILETEVFSTSTGKVVWNCHSDTLMTGFLDDLIQSFAVAMTQSFYSSAAQ